MNPQMQNYRPYPHGRPPAAAARRQGECDSSTPCPCTTQEARYMHPVAEENNDSNNSYDREWVKKNSLPRREFCQRHDSGTPVPPLITAPVPTPHAPTSLNDLTQGRHTPAQQSFDPSFVNIGPRLHPQYVQPYSQITSIGQVHPGNQISAQQAHHIQAQQTSQRNAVMEYQGAKRRAYKPSDRNLPDDIEDLVIGDGVQQYIELQALEKRLDFALIRKRVELQDVLHRAGKRHKTMRIWITNTAENQPWQGGGLDENAFDFHNGNESTYRVKIEGRLLNQPGDDPFESDDEDEEGDENKIKEQPIPTQRMSHFFKAMSVEFDRSKGGAIDPNQVVEWKKQPGQGDLDQFCFSRRGDENMNITIDLVRDEVPERFRLSNALAQTLDMAEADRAEVVMGLWEYVKLFGLQEDEEKRMIRCDDALRQIFGVDTIFFPHIPERITPHLHPLPPLKLPYTIRVDEAFVSNPVPTIYDVTVQVEDPIRVKVFQLLQNPEYAAQLRQVAKLDDEIALVIQAIQHSKSKHQFMKAFVKDPVGFINKWTSSQKRDLEVILGEAARGGGEDGMGAEFSKGGKDGVWGSEPVQEAVRYMLAKPEVGKTN